MTQNQGNPSSALLATSLLYRPVIAADPDASQLNRCAGIFAMVDLPADQAQP